MNFRLKNLPKLPTNLEEIKIEGEWSLTSNKERFLISSAGSSNDKAIVFCSQVGLKILSVSKRWHADGTFETLPILHYSWMV